MIDPGMNARVPGWDQRLRTALEAELAVPYDWTTANCGHLMCASVEACMGSDHPALAMRQQFTSEEAVKDLIKTAGGIDKILTRWFKPIGLFSIMRGDLVVIGTDEVQAGAVWMDGCIIGKVEGARKGIGGFRLPRNAAKFAFRVG